jgi:hypothetical protein
MSSQLHSRRRFITAFIAGTAAAVMPSTALAARKRRPRRKKNNNNNNRKPTPAGNPVLTKMFGSKWTSASLSPNQQKQLTVLALQFAQANASIEQSKGKVYTTEQRDVLERAYTQAVRAGVNPDNIPKRVEEARKTLQFTPVQTEEFSKLKQQQELLKSQYRAAAGKFLNQQQMAKLFGK